MTDYIEILHKKPIWIEDNILDTQQLNYLENTSIDLSNQFPDYNHTYNPDTFKTSRNVGIKIHTMPEYATINQIIIDRAKKMSAEMGYSKKQLENLVIGDSWFCIYKPGDCVQMHIHRPYFLTAAFYIKNLTACKLRFMHNIYSYAPWPAMLDNEWSKNSTDMDCPPGRLLLFPSDCAHGTDQIKTTSHTGIVKVMLSYNLMFKS